MQRRGSAAVKNTTSPTIEPPYLCAKKVWFHRRRHQQRNHRANLESENGVQVGYVELFGTGHHNPMVIETNVRQALIDTHRRGAP